MSSRTAGQIRMIMFEKPGDDEKCSLFRRVDLVKARRRSISQPR